MNGRELIDYRAGYRAYRTHQPREKRQSIDWLRGWDDAAADDRLEREEDAE